MKVRFKLITPLNGYKVGKIFDTYLGLVSGVNGIPFTDQSYFKLIKNKQVKGWLKSKLPLSQYIAMNS